jgi:hypothetical protein
VRDTFSVEETLATFLARQAFIAFSRIDKVCREVTRALTFTQDPRQGAAASEADLALVAHFKDEAEASVDRHVANLATAPPRRSARAEMEELAEVLRSIDSSIHELLAHAESRLLSAYSDENLPALNDLAERLLAPPVLPVGLNALLVTAVYTFERCIAGVIRVITALSSDAHWDDVEHVVDRALRNRGWIDHLCGRGVDIRSLTPHWTQVEEVLARRNAIVHRGGRVDLRYLAATNRAETPDGESLDVDERYLARSVDALAALAIVLATTVHQRPGSAGEDATQFALHYLRSGQPYRAESILLGASDAYYRARNPRDLAIWRVNVALARKMQHGVDAISAEVLEWTIPPSEPTITLGRDILLDREIPVKRLIRLVNERRLTWDDVRTWPLFKQLRQQSPELRRLIGPPRAGSVDRSPL